MARARRSKPGKQPASSGQIRVFPHELRPGDRVVLEDGQQWEVADHPEVFKQGKAQRVNLRRPGDEPAETRTEDWPAHERVTVRRAGAPPAP
jgi:hypothetical protein